MIERRITIGFLVTVLIQTAVGLMWAGAAAQRISTLETEVAERRPVAERLARVEAELELMRQQLQRIETKVDTL